MSQKDGKENKSKLFLMLKPIAAGQEGLKLIHNTD